MRQCPKCGSNKVYKCSKLNKTTGYINIWYGCMYCSYTSEEYPSDTDKGIELMSDWNDLES